MVCCCICAHKTPVLVPPFLYTRCAERNVLKELILILSCPCLVALQTTTRHTQSILSPFDTDTWQLVLEGDEH